MFVAVSETPPVNVARLDFFIDSQRTSAELSYRVCPQ